MNELRTYPFIQTHTFHVEPFLQRTQGYAPFISSSLFIGIERVKFQSLAGICFPNTQTSELTLNEFSHAKWFLAKTERVKSATSGPLLAGKYRFLIERTDADPAHVDLNYHPHFVEPVTISVRDGPAHVKVSWSKPLAADNFWLFILPVNTSNFLADLLPVTENKYLLQSAVLAKSDLPTGAYRCVVRANEMLKVPDFIGFSSESWGISDNVFNVP